MKRLNWTAQAITAATHVVVWAALLLWLSPLEAALGSALLAAWTMLRLRTIARDPPRPRWVTHGLDCLAVCHWATLILASVAAIAALSIQAGAFALGAGAPDAPLTCAVGYAMLFPLPAWGVWGRRHRIALRTVRLGLPGLPEAFSGYRIAHISDLHIGSFDTKARGLDWVDQVNRLVPDLTVVTGDLVTHGTRFYSDVTAVLKELKAKDGVWVSMGNHDQWDNAALTAALSAAGIGVLRNEAVALERPGQQRSQRLMLAGLDDLFTNKADLDRTLSNCTFDDPVVLLSHYPSFFGQAAQRGVQLVLSGHTHGGQIGVPFFSKRWNISRLSGAPHQGLHRLGASTLYVNAGLGTTGIPLRLGVPPEIALLELQ